MLAAAPDLYAELSGLLDQLRAIGIPDWHGAEGLDLTGAESALAKVTAANPLF